MSAHIREERATRWQLKYLSFDSMENDIAYARITVTVPLGLADPADVDEAIARARAKWCEVRDTTYRGWDGETYPQKPRLVWEYEL